MNDAEKLIADVARKHRIERCSVSSPTESHQWGRCTGCDFESYTFPIKGINWDLLAQEILADHLGEEIVKALGGLTRQWAVRYHDGGVTTRPSPGMPSAEIVERARTLLTDREVVIGWVSEWKPVQP